MGEDGSLKVGLPRPGEGRIQSVELLATLPNKFKSPRVMLFKAASWAAGVRWARLKAGGDPMELLPGRACLTDGGSCGCALFEAAPGPAECP